MRSIVGRAPWCAALVLGCGGRADPPERVDTGDAAEDCAAWPDADLDGYVTFAEGCCPWTWYEEPLPEGCLDEWPGGWTSGRWDFEDCDDHDPAAHWGAPEIPYDGVDQDCSGLDDEYDADGDGYDAAGYGGDDCEDATPAAHPGASEWCGDGVDGDCDGAIDEEPCGEARSVAGAPTWLGGEDDFLGDAVALADPLGDGVVSVVVSQREDLVITGRIPVGAEGIAAGEIGRISAATLSGPAVDLTGDGLDDLLVGFPQHTSIEVMPGPLDATRGLYGGTWDTVGLQAAVLGDVTGDGARDLVVDEEVFGGPFASGASTIPRATLPVGRSCVVRSAGELDGDGVDDLLVTSTTASSDALLVFTGPVAGALDTVDAAAEIASAREGLVVGDVDGDGRDDLVTGTPTTAGALHVLIDPLGTGARSADLTFEGLRPEQPHGGLGDTDGDGRAEVWVAYAGILVFSGPFEGSLAAVDDATWVTLPTGATESSTAAGGRDVDGDGWGDFVVGFPVLDGRQGAVVLVTGAE